MDKIMKTQYIGLDIGRGYVKAYSKFEGKEYKCNFKSIVSDGRSIYGKDYEDSIYIEIDGAEYFVGELAELEGYNPIQNLIDSKVKGIVPQLLLAALNEIAVADFVSIALGVPNKLFKKTVLEEVEEKYKNKTFKIKNKITGSTKKVTIKNITIYREADAALLWHVSNHPTLANGPVALVSVGFRTSEFCYYDKGLKYNEKLSDTRELGNKTALENVRRKLKDVGIIQPLSVIDTSDNYDDFKKQPYEMLSASIETEIENLWPNNSEVTIFIAGGTALRLDLPHELLEGPQMATSKGLFQVAVKRFCN